MGKQLIISVEREYGSGGHVIAEALAERFKIPLYDNKLLEQIEQEKELEAGSLKKYDEQPGNRLLSRHAREHSSSMEEHTARMQFAYLRKMADRGDSFVVVGRCSETVLKGYAGLVSIFVLADVREKEKRIRFLCGGSGEKAGKLMRKADRQRKKYHSHYCRGKWGDPGNYDFSINESRLGIDGTVDILETCIRARMARQEQEEAGVCE